MSKFCGHFGVGLTESLLSRLRVNTGQTTKPQNPENTKRLRKKIQNPPTPDWTPKIRKLPKKFRHGNFGPCLYFFGRFFLFSVFFLYFRGPIRVGDFFNFLYFRDSGVFVVCTWPAGSPYLGEHSPINTSGGWCADFAVFLCKHKHLLHPAGSTLQRVSCQQA